jgi:hypothetical protein
MHAAAMGGERTVPAHTWHVCSLALGPLAALAGVVCAAGHLIRVVANLEVLELRGEFVLALVVRTFCHNRPPLSEKTTRRRAPLRRAGQVSGTPRVEVKVVATFSGERAGVYAAGSVNGRLANSSQNAIARTACTVLEDALRELREALRYDWDRTLAQVVEDLLEALSGLEPAAPASQASERMAAVAVARGDRRASVADIVGEIARRLGSEDGAPATTHSTAAWQALITTADRLYGSGVAPMGRLPFISDRLLELMLDEAREHLPQPAPPSTRSVASGGRALASLAVSGKLQKAVSGALGIPVASGYHALYAYDPPESHVRVHLDSREYEFIFHMVLEHRIPADGSAGSALVAHLPERAEPSRTWLRPGEGVALCGRGTIHSWQPLQRGESRTLVDIALVRA